MAGQFQVTTDLNHAQKMKRKKASAQLNKRKLTFSRSWYLVIRWTGLIKKVFSESRWPLSLRMFWSKQHSTCNAKPKQRNSVKYKKKPGFNSNSSIRYTCTMANPNHEYQLCHWFKHARILLHFADCPSFHKVCKRFVSRRASLTSKKLVSHSASKDSERCLFLQYDTYSWNWRCCGNSRTSHSRHELNFLPQNMAFLDHDRMNFYAEILQCNIRLLFHFLWQSG